MPCRTCGGQKRITVPIARASSNSASNAGGGLVDEDMILITYENPNRGQHKVVGANTKTKYGYRAGGGTERFYVHKKDIAAHPDWFIPYKMPERNVEQTSAPLPPPPPAILNESIPMVESTPIVMPGIPDFIETKNANEPVISAKPMDKPDDLQAIPGVTEKIAEALRKKGVKNSEGIVEIGEAGLMHIEGVGEKRAAAIYNRAKKLAKFE